MPTPDHLIGRYDPAPLTALADRRLGTDRTTRELAHLFRVSWATAAKIESGRPLTYPLADRCAVLLGFHPAELWPDWFDHALAAPAAKREPATVPARVA